MTDEIDKNYRDQRTKQVLGFFVAKGLLIAPWIRKLPVNKLRIPDVLWVAEHVEPRVLEVLPAALLHFPAAFLQKEQLPQDMKNLMVQIARGEKTERLVRGIPFKNFSRWAEKAFRS